MFVLIREFWSCLSYPRRYDSPGEISVKSILQITLLHYMVFFPVVLVFSLLIQLLGLDHLDHAFDDAILDFPMWMIVLVAVILAPVVEELIFRGSLGYLMTRRRDYNQLVFYMIAMAFAFLHIFNFDTLPSWWLTPILVLPQFSLALVLGFLRLRFGLLASIYVHALNNLLPVLMLFLARSLDI